MSSKSLPLLIQSARDALGDCLADLEKALAALDLREQEEEPGVVRASQLERARAQCLAAHRTLEDMARRMR